MQPEHRVEPVEDPAQLDDVLTVGALRPDLVEESPEPANLMTDLDVTPAHRPGGVAAPEHSIECDVELTLFGLFVGFDFLDEQSVQNSQQQSYLQQTPPPPSAVPPAPPAEEPKRLG